MGIAAAFIRLAKQSFFNLTVAFILFYLPIEVLFRFNSWSHFMPVSAMINEISMMILVIALISAALSLTVAGVGCTLLGLSRSIGKTVKTIEEAVCAAVAIGSLAIIILFLLRTLKIWLEVVAGTIFKIGVAKLLLLPIVVGLFVVLVRKYGLLSIGNSIRSNLDRGTKLVLILILSAALVIGTKGVALHNYHEIKVNPIYPTKAGLPNVILLTIDTLAAGDMSLYGYHLATTPRLEKFGRESYVFDNFFASSNWTTPSVASLISGLYPITNGVHNVSGYFLEGDQKKNLAQALGENGYETVAISANARTHPLSLQISDSFSAAVELQVRKLLVADSMFSELSRLKHYQTYYWVSALVQPVFRAIFSNRNETTSLWPPAMAFDRAIPFLTNPKQPLFVWTHILPPHSPYLPAAPFKYKFGNFKAFSTFGDYEKQPLYYSQAQQAEVDQQRLRYDEFILDTDAAVGDFLDKLKTTGRFDDSIIVITSDHGESFAKNYLTHGGPYLHQSLIHIPLMVHLPGQIEGKRIPFYAGHVDLLPTIMSLLDLPIPEWSEGESLTAAMLKGRPTSMPKFSMNLDRDSRFAPPHDGTLAVMHGGWKFVRYLSNGNEELYHLAIDPNETTNLARRNPEQVRAMRDMIYARFALAR